LTLWLENTIRLKTNPTTFDRYKLVVEKQIKPFLGPVRLDKLTGFHVAKLYADLEKAGESVRAQQMAGTVLFGALKYAPRKLFCQKPEPWFRFSGDPTKPPTPHRPLVRPGQYLRRI
jgi:hypothetical protein